MVTIQGHQEVALARGALDRTTYHENSVLTARGGHLRRVEEDRFGTYGEQHGLIPDLRREFQTIPDLPRTIPDLPREFRTYGEQLGFCCK